MIFLNQLLGILQEAAELKNHIMSARRLVASAESSSLWRDFLLEQTRQREDKIVHQKVELEALLKRHKKELGVFDSEQSVQQKQFKLRHPLQPLETEEVSLSSNYHVPAAAPVSTSNFTTVKTSSTYEVLQAVASITQPLSASQAPEALQGSTEQPVSHIQSMVQPYTEGQHSTYTELQTSHPIEELRREEISSDFLGQAVNAQIGSFGDVNGLPDLSEALYNPPETDLSWGYIGEYSTNPDIAVSHSTTSTLISRPSTIYTTSTVSMTTPRSKGVYTPVLTTGHNSQVTTPLTSMQTSKAIVSTTSTVISEVPIMTPVAQSDSSNTFAATGHNNNNGIASGSSISNNFNAQVKYNYIIENVIFSISLD